LIDVLKNRSGDMSRIFESEDEQGILRKIMMHSFYISDWIT